MKKENEPTESLSPSDHARHAEAAIRAALAARGEAHAPSNMESVADLLADLRHYCDQEDVSWDDALYMSGCYFADETDAESDEFDDDDDEDEDDEDDVEWLDLEEEEKEEMEDDVHAKN